MSKVVEKSKGILEMITSCLQITGKDVHTHTHVSKFGHKALNDHDRIASVFV